MGRRAARFSYATAPYGNIMAASSQKPAVHKFFMPYFFFVKNRILETCPFGNVHTWEGHSLLGTNKALLEMKCRSLKTCLRVISDFITCSFLRERESWCRLMAWFNNFFCYVIFNVVHVKHWYPVCFNILNWI